MSATMEMAATPTAPLALGPNNPTVVILNRRNKKQIAKLSSDSRWIVLDVSSRSTDPVFMKFSPTFPHGGIPVPGRPDTLSTTVEGVWQGLKTFKDGSGIDTSKFRAKTPSAVTRGKRKFGEVAGYLLANTVVDEHQARIEVYAPAYQWVLEHNLQAELMAMLEQLRLGKSIALLDHCTGEDIHDQTKRFSHAAIIKAWLARAASA